MKRAHLFTALCALTLVMTACAAQNGTGTNGFGNGSSAGSSFRNSARTLTPEAKLALGTIKLEGTAQAVDPKTAAKLLPLWQLMVQLHSSSSTAPQEVTAVMDQIKASMAPSQVNTIDRMSLTAADLFSLLQSQAQASAGSSGTTRTGQAGFAGGNRQGGRQFFFSGPPPGGEFGGGLGGGGARTTTGNGSTSASQLTPEEQAQALQARENATSTLVEDQLIRLLETKLHSQPG